MNRPLGDKAQAAKTTLTVEVEYDPETTDPESLAAAMDRLMEMALSTPGVMDEYGSPRVGEFLVAKPASGASGGELQLQISSPLFHTQRQLLMKIVELACRNQPYVPQPGDEELLDGLLNLTDTIADMLPE